MSVVEKQQFTLDTNQCFDSLLQLDDGLLRLALVIAPAVDLTKDGKRLQTERDEDKFKQAGRATATLEIDKEERKSMMLG